MEKELCVRCGKETAYDQSTPIEMRRWYVEGSGQLCEACFAHLYGLAGAFGNDGVPKTDGKKETVKT